MKHSFNKEKKAAGKKWFYSFMRRHPRLSPRQPEATLMARVTAFNKEHVNSFFALYEHTIKTPNGIMSPAKIFNMDETRLQTVQKLKKILGWKGKHQVGGIVSAERGETATCVCCISAAGPYVPPLLIFKPKHNVNNLKDGAPPGTMFTCQVSRKWLDEFRDILWMASTFYQNCVPIPNKDSKVLLLLDGHASHTKNLEDINIAREAGVIMLSFLPHCSYGYSHWMSHSMVH